MKVGGWTYYLLVTIDLCSRFVRSHEILRWMDEKRSLSAIETVPEDVRSGVTVQSDNGSILVSYDFARVLREDGARHVSVRPHTPEENRMVERVTRALGEPLCEDELDSFTQGQTLDQSIDWYNHRRPHSCIEHLTPASVDDRTADRILAERRAKLADARHRRRQGNLKIRQLTLPLSMTGESPARSQPKTSRRLILSDIFQDNALLTTAIPIVSSPAHE